MTFRLIVTGSRTWTDRPSIERALAAVLARHPEGVTIVHGACPRGADAIAAAWAARTPGVTVEPHPADWKRHGRAAGHIRNREMADIGAGGCAAFHLDNSPGTAGMIREATAAGIPVWTIHPFPRGDGIR
jgi:hypothetical protein